MGKNKSANKVIAVIPARFGSVRFPGKPLVNLCGKPLLQWVIEGANESERIAQLIVATDDQRIMALVENLMPQIPRLKAVLTSSELPSGTDRVFQGIRDEVNCDIVVNVQGDEPLTTGAHVDNLAHFLEADSKLEMATLAHPLVEDDLNSKNSVKVIINERSEAIYFSRFGIPYSRHEPQFENGKKEKLDHLKGVYKHIGMYAYRRDFLEKFCKSPVAVIEAGESLEQLRALYLGAKIKVLKISEPVYGVDTPEDLDRVAKFIENSPKRSFAIATN